MVSGRHSGLRKWNLRLSLLSKTLKYRNEETEDLRGQLWHTDLYSRLWTICSDKIDSTFRHNHWPLNEMTINSWLKAKNSSRSAKKDSSSSCRVLFWPLASKTLIVFFSKIPQTFRLCKVYWIKSYLNSSDINFEINEILMIIYFFDWSLMLTVYLYL